MSLLTKQEFKAELVNELKNIGLSELSPDFVEELSACLFTINELMHYKLTVRELNNSYSFLSGLLSGEYPKIAIAASNDDKIRLAYSMFEIMESTQGKLSQEEKVMYAFCVFHSVCVEFFDEETETIRKGIWEINSPEHAEKLLKWEKDNHPERFTFLQKITSKDSNNFGITKLNPIMAVTIQDSYNYLNHLRTADGEVVNYKRLGAIINEFGCILDKYKLSFKINGIQRELEIYIDPYANENSTTAPDGLILSLSEKKEPQTQDNVQNIQNILYNPLLLDRPVPNKQYLQDRTKAGMHLEHKFSEFEGLCDKHEDFRWIKSKLSYPAFDDITFAYRNQIFSVIVKRTNDEHRVLKQDKKINNLIRECRNNNLIPCIFPISSKTGSPLYPDTWNLFNVITGKFVNPIQQSSDKLIEVSKWELNNWAIQIVSDYIKGKKCKLLSFCDVLGIDPQIWFEDNHGDKCWIKVIYATYPDTGEIDSFSFSFEKWPSEVLKHRGFIAKVSFCNSENPSDKIYRSKGAFVSFKGIVQIHD